MKTKQRRRTLRMLATCSGVPHLSMADEMRGDAPPDEVAANREMEQLKALIKAKGLELTRGRSVLDGQDAEDWMEPD